MFEKSHFRSKLKNTNLDLGSELRRRISQSIVDNIVGYIKLRNQFEVIFLYSALPYEADVSAIVKMLPGRKFGFPRVLSPQEMGFFSVVSDNDLKLGTFGILEPNLDCKTLTPDANTVILVPGLGFSSRGDRLGHGRGFYDRYFKCYHESHTRIGVCFAQNYFEIAPWKTENHDVCMNAIVTENGFHATCKAD
ncbi:MAG: 5-formyltetrahydrofolate cyclo-ligase [Proteobacteria bacterium]|nr:5-formyltetrahydrofolate cyclo-ligase [Pseudomonadota bacterium]